MKQRGASRQISGRVVFEYRSDDRALRECGFLSKCILGKSGRCHSSSQQSESLPASHGIQMKFWHSGHIVFGNSGTGPKFGWRVWLGKDSMENGELRLRNGDSRFENG